MSIDPHSNWGDLHPETIARIKESVRQAVADGFDDAMRQGAMRDAIAEGVTIGVQTVAMDEDLFDLLAARASESLRKSLVRNTGTLVLSAAARMARSALWLAVAAVVVFSLGGWKGVSAAWHYINTGPTP